MRRKTTSSPLGQRSASPDRYDAGLLFAIARSDSRRDLAIGDALPFTGTDIWNAWELTWLGANGRPEVAHCEIRVPAESVNIIESKSLKLYLNSYSMSRFGSAGEVQESVRADLARCVDSEVDVRLQSENDEVPADIAGLPGSCIDDLPVACDQWEVNAGLLVMDPATIVSESLHTHLLRSLCPVTDQPDTGSLLVRYQGPRIDAGSLLQYIVSYRKHNDFHEACVERIFLDLMDRCCCQELTVYARYQRRGGIDINPFRTNTNAAAENTRLWRQ